MSRMTPTKPTAASTLAPALGPAVAAGLIGAVILFVFAGPLSFSAGLVVVALFVGRIVGLSTRAGGARVEPAARTSVAVVVSLVAVTLGLLAAWASAVAAGGSLGPLDYLNETLGPLVPLQYIVATLAAWWSTR
jgi:hypothetical protein